MSERAYPALAAVTKRLTSFGWLFVLMSAATFVAAFTLTDDAVTRFMGTVAGACLGGLALLCMGVAELAKVVVDIARDVAELRGGPK